MGKGVVEKLKKEYLISEVWISYELHPETSTQCTALKEAHPDLNATEMISSLRRAGSAYNISFNNISWLANSSLALQAAEFAKAQGKFDLFHDLTFKAYFIEGKNISLKEEILIIAQKAGLNQEFLKTALDNKAYAYQLDENREKGKAFQVTGLPTFIINNDTKIVGVQPYRTFVQAIEKVL